MNDIRALITELVERGLDPIDAADIVARAAIAGATKAPRRASSGAERQARYRERQKLKEARQGVTGDVTTRHSDACDVTRDAPSPEKVSPIPPSKTNPIPPSPPKGGSSPREFERFWAEYPHKVGKRDAEAAFVRARRRVEFDPLMAGLAAYVAKTDDRPWCNPATWLNQDRWEDRPATVQPRGSPPQQPRKTNLADAFAAMRRSQEAEDEHRDAEDFRGPVLHLAAQRRN